jgi:hypothetical protein
MALEIVRNDDFIEYFLFLNIEEDSEAREDELLNKELAKITEIVKSYAANYIWHKDPFNLKTRNRNSHLLNPENESECRYSR